MLPTLLLTALACTIPEAGPLEAQYAEPGPETVQTVTRTLDDGTEAVAHLPEGDGPWPLVVWENGTANAASGYEGFLQHLASWGFVVVGAEDGQMGTGKRGVELIDVARAENGLAGSELEGQVDLEHVATAGTSQGAVGAINTMIRLADDGVVDTVLANALPSPVWIQAKDTYDAAAIDVPFFIASGSQDGLISPADENLAVLADVRGRPSLAAHLVGAGHTEVEDSGGQYTGSHVAWFLWRLTGDEDAGALFAPDGEIATGTRWTAVAFAE